MTIEEFEAKANKFVAKRNSSAMSNKTPIAKSKDDELREFEEKANRFIEKRNAVVTQPNIPNKAVETITPVQTPKETISSKMDELWVEEDTPQNNNISYKATSIKDFIDSVKEKKEKDLLNSGYSLNPNYNPNNKYSQKYIYTGDLKTGGLKTQQDVYNNSNALGKAKIIASNVGQKAKEIGGSLAYGVSKGLTANDAIARTLGMTQEDAARENLDLLNDLTGRTAFAEPSKGMQKAINVGNAAGGMGRFMLASAAIPAGGMVLSGAINGGLDAYGNYEDTEGIARKATSGAIFGGVAQGLSNVANPYVSKALSNAGLGNNMAANVGAKAVTDFASAVAGSRASNLPLKEEDKQSWGQTLLNAGFYTGFNAFGNILKSLNISKQNKAELNRMANDTFSKADAMYKEAMLTADATQRQAKLEQLNSFLGNEKEGFYQLVANQQLLGQDKLIKSIDDMFNMAQNQMQQGARVYGNTLGETGSVGNNNSLSIIGNNITPNNSLVKLPSKGTQVANNTNIPQNLPMSTFTNAQNGTQTVQNNQANEITPAEMKATQNGNMNVTEQNTVKQQIMNTINNNNQLTADEKQGLLQILEENSNNLTPDAIDFFNDTINNLQNNRLEQVTNTEDKKATYKKYLNDKTELDKTALETAKDSVPANKSGRRTKEQWLKVANTIGQQIYDLSPEEIERYAYRSWQETHPNQANNLNRQGKGFVKFTSDEWIDTITKSAQEAKAQTQANNKLPTQAEQVSKLPKSQNNTSTVGTDNLKQKQLDIIQKSNPMRDDYHTGIRTIDDIKTFKDTIDDDESFVWGDFSREDALKALEKGEVKVYSSRPIENGNFVSTSYNQAKEYAGNGKIYSKTVPLTDVAWINGDEGQYARVNKNVENVQQMKYNENRGEENGREANRDTSKRGALESQKEDAFSYKEYGAEERRIREKEQVNYDDSEKEFAKWFAKKYKKEPFIFDDTETNFSGGISALDNSTVLFGRGALKTFGSKFLGGHEGFEIINRDYKNIAADTITHWIDKIQNDDNFGDLFLDYIFDMTPKVKNYYIDKPHLIAKEIIGDLNGMLNAGTDINKTVYSKLNRSLVDEIQLGLANFENQIFNLEADEQSAISLPKNSYINPTEDLQKATEFVDNATEKDIKALEKMVEEAENHPERIGLQEFAQKAKRKLDKLKADSQRQIRYLREQVREGTAEQEDITNVLRAEREVAKERVAEAKEQFKEQKAIEQERRNTSRAGNDLLKIVRRLDKLKTTPDNRAMIDELIGDIDKTSKGITEKGKINLEKLKAEYETMQENNPDFIPSKDIEKKISRLDRKHISDMSLDDIRDLTDILRGVEHSIKTAKREIGVEHAREIYEIGEKAIEEIRNSKGDPAKNKVVDKLKGIYNTSTLSAKREFSKIGGWGNNEMAKQYQQLENGQTKQIDFQMRATKMFDDFNKQHKKEMEKWAGKKAEFIDTKILADGKRIKITPAMRMSLYLHSKNADNMRHIVGGGITIPNETLYKMGNYSEAYARGNVARLTPTQIKDIINGMTASEKEFADIAYNFFNGMSKEAINETSLVLNGYELATVDNYFPITTNKNFTRSEFESLVRDGTIEGMGMLKERASASNPIILEDITGVLLRQIDNVGKYYGMAIPLRNFNAVYNTTTTGFGDSVKNAVSQKWGTNATNYIENLVTDLQGSKKQHDWFDTLKGNFAQATLAFNAGVTAKQVASYPTAASVLGWKALKKGITRAIKNRKMSHEEFNNLIDKYTPYYWYRRQGSIDTEIGDIVRDKSFVNKAPFLTNWIQSADMLTTGRLLWSASEEYVLENNPELKEGTDQFYKEVANVYNRTILDTQPNYTVLQRPDILRSDNKLLKSVTMFQTQRMQNYNIAYESIAEYKVALNKYNASKTKANEQNLKQAKKNLAKSISGLIVAGVSIATITALNNKLLNRGKDYQNEDGEETFGSVTKGLAGDFMESMAGNVLWGSELYGFLTGNWYDLQAPQLDALNDIVNDISNFSTSISKAIEHKNIIYLYKSSNELAKTLATMFGIPLSNAEKYIGGVLRKVLPKQTAQMDALYNYSSNKKYFEGKVKNGENLTSAKEAGISAYDYGKAYEAQKGIEGIKNEDGKTITNSESVLKRKAIDEATPNLTQEQRKVLYQSFLSSKTVIDMTDSEFEEKYMALPTAKQEEIESLTGLSFLI